MTCPDWLLVSFITKTWTSRARELQAQLRVYLTASHISRFPVQMLISALSESRRSLSPCRTVRSQHLGRPHSTLDQTEGEV